MINVTATGSTAGGFLTLYPAGPGSPPNSSSLNFAAGQTIPIVVTVQIGASGQVSFATEVGATGVVADLGGYFATD